MHTLSTRMGKGCKLVFTADPNQLDRKGANWASTGLIGYANRLGLGLGVGLGFRVRVKGFLRVGVRVRVMGSGMG